MKKGWPLPRAGFLAGYFVGVFFFWWFLVPLGDKGWVTIVTFSFMLGAPIALACADMLPLAYCTVLKGVILAGLAALAPVLIFCGPVFITKIVLGR